MRHIIIAPRCIFVPGGMPSFTAFVLRHARLSRHLRIADHAREKSASRTLQLAPGSHHEALAVLVTHLELPHSGSLGRLLVWGLDNPDVLRTLSARD